MKFLWEALSAHRESIGHAYKQAKIRDDREMRKNIELGTSMCKLVETRLFLLTKKLSSFSQDTLIIGTLQLEKLTLADLTKQ